MHLAPARRVPFARPVLASPLHAPFFMRSFGQILSLGFWRGGANAGETRGERAACGSDEESGQASGAGREGGRARRGVSFRLTDLLLLAALTFSGFHLLMEPMRAASGLSADDIARSGPHVTAVCALGVILVTRVGMLAGFALARLFGGKGGASLGATLGCVLCAWSLLYGAGSKGLTECFRYPQRQPSGMELIDAAFAAAEGDPGSATPKGAWLFADKVQPKGDYYPETGSWSPAE